MKNNDNETKDWLKWLFGISVIVIMAVQTYTLAKADANRGDISSLKDNISEQYLRRDDYREALRDLKTEISGLKGEIKNLNAKFDDYVVRK